MPAFKKSIVAIVASAALAAPAATAGPAFANEQDGLVNVYAENLLNGNQVVVAPQVAVPIAAAICGINANVLSTQLASGNNVKCGALSSVVQNAWISYH